MQGIQQGVAAVNGLPWSEVILGILVPLIFGAYAYAYLGFRSIWTGLKELDERLRLLRENALHDLEQRLERLERGR